MLTIFYGCSSLTSLNLSNFNTNKVEDMNGIFSDINKNKCKLICNDDNLKNEFK